MNNIYIEWLTDSYDCEQAGCSGGYAEGAIVHLDGAEFLSLEPIASCFGSEANWTEAEVYKRIIEQLGYSVIVHE